MVPKKKHSDSLLHSDLQKIFPQGCGNLLHILFSPYLKDIQESVYVINCCSLEKFKRKFKITSDLLMPIQKLWNEGSGLILAGGKMIDFFMNKNLNESGNDYDCFFLHDDARDKTEDLLRDNGYVVSSDLGYVTEFISIAGHQYEDLKIQTIRSTYANPEHIIESFDIRTCSICCDGRNVYWIKGMLRDTIDKKIVMTNPRIGANVFERIHKYINKGYTIALPDLAIASLKLLDAIASNCHYIPERERIWDRNYTREREYRTTYIEGEAIEMVPGGPGWADPVDIQGLAPDIIGGPTRFAQILDDEMVRALPIIPLDFEDGIQF